MTRTWSKVGLGASLSLLLLTACAREAGGRKTGASRSDAGNEPDASAQQNEIASGGAGEAAANGGSGNGKPRPAATAGIGGSNAGGAGGKDGPSAPHAPVAGAGSGGNAAHSGNGLPAGGASGTKNPSADADAGSEPRDPNAICTSCGACEETQKIVSNMHTNMPMNYPDPPPTSGAHNPCWGSWGVHDEPLAAERWVHNLEHGGIVFLYNCPDGCADEVATIKNIASSRARTIVTAYDKLPARFAVVAWGHRLVSECLDEQAFVAFYRAHFDQGPESNTMQPNPSCPP